MSQGSIICLQERLGRWDTTGLLYKVLSSFIATAEQQALGSKWRKTERARARETREASDTSQKHIFIKTKRVTVAFYGKYKCLHTCLHDQNNQGSFAWWWDQGIYWRADEPSNHLNTDCQQPCEGARLRGGSLIEPCAIVPGAEKISNRCNIE